MTLLCVHFVGPASFSLTSSGFMGARSPRVGQTVTESPPSGGSTVAEQVCCQRFPHCFRQYHGSYAGSRWKVTRCNCRAVTLDYVILFAVRAHTHTHTRPFYTVISTKHSYEYVQILRNAFRRISSSLLDACHTQYQTHLHCDVKVPMTPPLQPNWLLGCGLLSQLGALKQGRSSSSSRPNTTVLTSKRNPWYLTGSEEKWSAADVSSAQKNNQKQVRTTVSSLCLIF